MTTELRWRDAIFIGLGANLGHPLTQVRQALGLLSSEPGLRLLRVSRAWQTPAWGGVVQADFINAVAEFSACVDGRTIVATLLRIERALGRERGGLRWGPRVLDLDLLLDGQSVVDSHELRVPHPRMHERAFVLLPLAELAPAAPIPGHGSVADCLARLPDQQRDEARVVAESLEPLIVSHG